MAVEVASLKAVLDLDKRGFDSGLKGAATGLTGFKKQAGGALDTLGKIGGVVAGFAVVGAAIGGMIDAAREAIAVNKDLEQTILSTGGVAGVTAQAARDLADSLSLVTNFSDDAILAGENLLLTFTNIGKDVFPKATETMLDMSQKMGQDLKSSAIQLGKALNDPVKGMGALTRIGVSFSATQKQQVKDFMAVNDVAKAQGVILDAIATQGFGGMAKAMADPFIQLQNAIGEIQEGLGMALMPMLLEAAKVVLPALRDAAKAVGPELGELGLVLGKAFGENLVGIIGLFVDLAGHLGTFLKGMNELGVALGISSESAGGLHLALLPLKITFTIIGAALHILGAILSSIAFIIKTVAASFNTVNETTRQAQINAQGVITVWTAMATAGQFLWTWIQNIVAGWRMLIATMSQSISIPTWLTPGSPTPLELGLRGVSSAIKSMPALPSFGPSTGSGFGGMGGMTPIASGGGGSSTINVNIGGVSATSQTMGDPATEAIRLTVQLLRQQLDR